MWNTYGFPRPGEQLGMGTNSSAARISTQEFLRDFLRTEMQNFFEAHQINTVVPTQPQSVPLSSGLTNSNSDAVTFEDQQGNGSGRFRHGDELTSTTTTAGVIELIAWAEHTSSPPIAVECTPGITGSIEANSRTQVCQF